jgi:putative transposase
MRHPAQRQLPFHGGPRRGSGRPRGNRTSHAARPQFHKPTPAHVTLRMKPHVWNLRSRRCYSRIRAAFENARGRFGARLVEYSVQGNHLHLIIEADDSAALSRGMQGLTIRIAKALNALMGRAGTVFDDHYFARLLKTPTELVRAIRYVLDNAARHFGEAGADPFSSAALAKDAAEVAAPVGWLLRIGLRRAAPRLVLRW